MIGAVLREEGRIARHSADVRGVVVHVVEILINRRNIRAVNRENRLYVRVGLTIIGAFLVLFLAMLMYYGAFG